MSKQFTIAEAQANLPKISRELADEPAIITEDGIPVMAAMSYDRLIELLETLDILSDTAFTAKLRQSIEQVENGQTISWVSAKVALGL